MASSRSAFFTRVTRRLVLSAFVVLLCTEKWITPLKKPKRSGSTPSRRAELSSSRPRLDPPRGVCPAPSVDKSVTVIVRCNPPKCSRWPAGGQRGGAFARRSPKRPSSLHTGWDCGDETRTWNFEVDDRFIVRKPMGPGGPPGLQNRSLPAFAGRVSSTLTGFRQPHPGADQRFSTPRPATGGRQVASRSGRRLSNFGQK
jgi:hypothetical protein